MKIELCVKYLVYISLLIAIIVFWEYVGSMSDRYCNRNFSPSCGYTALTLLIGVCVGLVLGLEHLINEIKKEGSIAIFQVILGFVIITSLYKKARQ